MNGWPARDAVCRWVPQARPLSVGAFSFGTAVASLLTVATLWLVTQGDLLALFAGLAGERARAAFGGAAQELAAALFGQQFLAIGAGLAALGFVTAATGAVVGLRALATSSRTRG